jgi:non-ribosomal peptide synthetase-like protein
LSIINADYSNTSFRVTRATIGTHNFVGNQVGYPAQGRTGDNCLLATKVMIPLDGPVREGVGLLGSPSFEIPRSVERDSRFDHLRTGEALRRGLAAKNEHNAATIAWYLLIRWFYLFATLLIAAAGADSYSNLGALAIMLTNVSLVAFTIAYYVLVERAVTRFRALRPLFCSIYQIGFWRIERLWKLPEMGHLAIFNGTPFRGFLWRLLGVRMGRRVFDDGSILMERTMITIGPECTLNLGSRVQTHSQEDGTFKSDRTTLGAGCTVGINALVHYGVTMGDGAVLACDSFLMKGEEMPADARWGGNPAKEMGDDVRG